MSLRETLSGNKRPGWFLTFEGLQAASIYSGATVQEFHLLPFSSVRQNTDTAPKRLLCSGVTVIFHRDSNIFI